MIFLRLKLFHPLFVIMNADFRMNVRIFKRQIIKLCTLFIYVLYLSFFLEQNCKNKSRQQLPLQFIKSLIKNL